MIWHEIVCDDCHTVLDGFSGTENYNAKLKKLAKAAGWRVQRNGTAYCPDCQKKLKP